ncbi:hypothetical protein KKG52_00720 [Patescibacteria group bacterium]|nr:hypothetical protein [Patescibacteria group bacterium]
MVFFFRKNKENLPLIIKLNIESALQDKWYTPEEDEKRRTLRELNRNKVNFEHDMTIFEILTKRGTGKLSFDPLTKHLDVK